MPQRMKAGKTHLWLGDLPLETLSCAQYHPFPPPEAGEDHADGSGVDHSLRDAEKHPDPKQRPGQ